MNKFTQRIPGGFDPFMEPETFEFETQEELLNSQGAVKRFAEMENFNEYQLDDNLLMAVYENGYRWWCVGYIEEPEKLNLPKWEPKFREEEEE